MKKIIILTFLSATLLVGCSTQASRMAECEAQGVSKDACYIAEKNHQDSIENAAESQALRNAAAQYGQTTHKPKKMQVYIKGVEIKIYPQDKQAWIESTAAALTEENEHVQVYQKGIFTAIWYKLTHKIMLLRDGHLVGKSRV